MNGVQGAVYQMLAHGVSTGGLFLIVGMLSDRRHTRLIAEFGGLKAVAPKLVAAFLLITLASVALPGTNGFVGEFLILVGAFKGQFSPNAQYYTAVAATGVILSAVYMLWMFQRVNYGPLTNPEEPRPARSEPARVGGDRADLRDGDRHGRGAGRVPAARWSRRCARPCRRSSASSVPANTEARAAARRRRRPRRTTDGRPARHHGREGSLDGHPS